MAKKSKSSAPAAVRKYLSEIGKQGGKSRMAGASAAERSTMARKGGKAGGPARAKALSEWKRREIARKAAKARWGKRR